MSDQEKIYVPGPLQAPEEEPQTPAAALDLAGSRISDTFEQLTILNNSKKIKINRADLATAMQTIRNLSQQMPNLSFSTLDTFESFIDAIGFAKRIIEAIRMDSDDFL